MPRARSARRWRPGGRGGRCGTWSSSRRTGLDGLSELGEDARGRVGIDANPGVAADVEADERPVVRRRHEPERAPPARLESQIEKRRAGSRVEDVRQARAVGAEDDVRVREAAEDVLESPGPARARRSEVRRFRTRLRGRRHCLGPVAALGAHKAVVPARVHHGAAVADGPPPRRAARHVDRRRRPAGFGGDTEGPVHAPPDRGDRGHGARQPLLVVEEAGAPAPDKMREADGRGRKGRRPRPARVEEEVEDRDLVPQQVAVARERVEHRGLLAAQGLRVAVLAERLREREHVVVVQVEHVLRVPGADEERELAPRRAAGADRRVERVVVDDDRRRGQVEQFPPARVPLVRRELRHRHDRVSRRGREPVKMELVRLQDDVPEMGRLVYVFGEHPPRGINVVDGIDARCPRLRIHLEGPDDEGDAHHDLTIVSFYWLATRRRRRANV